MSGQSFRAGASSAVAVLCTSLLAACSAAGPSVPSSPSSGAVAQRQSIAPLSGSPTPTPAPYEFKTVDDPVSNFNEVTGINAGGKIVGDIEVGVSAVEEGYTSEPPYTSFRTVGVTGALATVLTALNDKKDAVGYVVTPPSLSGTWALAKAKTLSIYKCSKEGDGNDHVTELWGVNDDSNAVGYYINGSGQYVPMESNITHENCKNLPGPSGATGAVATGINNKGDVAGYYWSSSSSEFTGFLMKAGVEYSFAYPGAVSTMVYGINYNDQIAGSFTDTEGNTHGFVLTNPDRSPSQQSWQQIDEPNAAGTTVVRGINLHHSICGYYIDSNGRYNGFVATPTST